MIRANLCELKVRCGIKKCLFVFTNPLALSPKGEEKIFSQAMDISEIKRRLTLSQVLHYYGLKPDKNLRLLCPFHEDRKPSMQVYYKTHTAYCFSSNCPTHGHSLDVVDFVMHKEGCVRRTRPSRRQPHCGSEAL